MAYNWKESAEGEGAGEKLPTGIHKVHGVKTVQGAGPKGPWVMLVVENSDGQEGSCVFTLTDKASWTLARWLSRCGEDLEAMCNDGIEPKNFGNPDIANKYLIDAETWVRVKPGQNPKYLDITPITEEEAQAEAPEKVAVKDKEALNLDDVPF